MPSKSLALTHTKAPHCKNRFCTYCCGIRKAELITKYLPVLQTWKAPHFVSLTIRAVNANSAFND